MPLEFQFLFHDSHVEVISGKQEGVFAWIALNFALGKLDHSLGGLYILLFPYFF